MDKQIKFKLTGTHPLLMHHDNLTGAEVLAKWMADPKNKNFSKAGDDRTPPWTWINYLYEDQDKGEIAMPFENVMKCLSLAGAKLKLGKGTFKQLTQIGLSPTEEYFGFINNGKAVPMEPIISYLTPEENRYTFPDHLKLAESLGFRLFCKRAKVGDRKHVRVRARFEKWAVEGTLDVRAEEFTLPILQELFKLAGRVGLCDWRPGSPKSPGPYGQFKAEVRWA